MIEASLQKALGLADVNRRAGRWMDAIRLYLVAARSIPDSAAVWHNIALCLLSLGKAKEAIDCAEKAVSLDGNLWQAAVLLGKALAEVGDVERAWTELRGALERNPDQAHIVTELAGLAIHHFGDAAQARSIVKPLLNDPEHSRDAQLTTLVTEIYDRDLSAENLSDRLIAFAGTEVQLPHVSKEAEKIPTEVGKSRNRRRRRRIGLMSPMFYRSPVYYFCIGALRELANSFDLIFIDRSQREDVGKEHFRRLAASWHPASQMDANALARALEGFDLDVLVDLGGWMDVHGMTALSTKPVPSMYKWVGGQSATTGLRVFDGMLTDRYQTPRALQHLYTEPLILLKHGYVTYTAPDYLPVPAPMDDTKLILGVIANPAKVSRAFLQHLNVLLPQLHSRCGRPITLRFIDKRYKAEVLQQRIRQHLRPATAVTDSHAVELEFVVPADHPAYLCAMARLTAVLDTFPYTGGLTTIEALAIGIPCYSRVGDLFSERHTYAHARYAGLKPSEFSLDHVDPMQMLKLRGRGNSLLRPGSLRLDHAGLAGDLARLFARQR